MANTIIILLNNEIEILKSNIKQNEEKVKQENKIISKWQLFIKTLTGNTIRNRMEIR